MKAVVKAAALVLVCVHGQSTISCPVLTCDAPIDSTIQTQVYSSQNATESDATLCYLHDNMQPAQQLRTYTCDPFNSGMICGLDLSVNPQMFSWYSEST